VGGGIYFLLHYIQMNSKSHSTSCSLDSRGKTVKLTTMWPSDLKHWKKYENYEQRFYFHPYV
jgi:hypothetical protein